MYPTWCLAQPSLLFFFTPLYPRHRFQIHCTCSCLLPLPIFATKMNARRTSYRGKSNPSQYAVGLILSDHVSRSGRCRILNANRKVSLPRWWVFEPWATRPSRRFSPICLQRFGPTCSGGNHTRCLLPVNETQKSKMINSLADFFFKYKIKLIINGYAEYVS